MTYKRTLCLLAGLAIQFCNGGLYAWSSFVPPLHSNYGLSFTQLAMIFSTTMLFFTSMMVIGGKMLKRQSARVVTMFSGILFALGYFTAAHSQGNFYALLLGLGIFGGIAIGLGYVSAISTCARWFPGRCGLVTGIVVSSFGISGLVISQVVTAQLTKGIDVLALFGHIGIVYSLVILTSSFFLVAPRLNKLSIPQNYSCHSFRIKLDSNIWALIIGMFSSTFGGLLIISNLKPLVMSIGSSPQTATWVIGAFALGNAVGRILWGRLVDHIGQSAITISLICLFMALLLLSISVSSIAVISASAFLGICFGAAFVVYAARVAHDYGPDGLELIYPWIFLSYGLAGITGPIIGGWMTDTLGDYRLTILFATGVTALGILMIAWLRQRNRYCPKTG